MSESVYLGLGSNLGTPEENLRTALKHLEKTEGVEGIRVSPFYKSDPFGVTDQPEFVNAAARLNTHLAPQDLLQSLLNIEKDMGRVREQKWGPRLIDLDILFFGNRLVDEPGLTIPHHGIAERAFVLVPLADLAPDLIHPIHKKTVKEMLLRLNTGSTVRKMGSDG